jgi:Zn-dependent peptidase ImmA (M78 family)
LLYKKDEEILYTIAHEIAHYWLDHSKMKNANENECELEADRLVEKWGFVLPKRVKRRMKILGGVL